MRFLLLLLLPIFSFAQNGLVTIKLGGSPLSSSAWNLNGNSIVDSNFLGTTNSKDLIFKTKNTEAMRIDTFGNVGIGTATPSDRLQIYGNTLCNGDIHFVSPDSSTRIYAGSLSATSKGFKFWSDDNTLEAFETSGGILTTLFQFSSNGNVSDQNLGIGLSGSPTAKLHVNGDLRIEGTDSVTIYAKTPANGTFEYCTNCTGNGITGRLLGYIGSAWRRFTIE